MISEWRLGEATLLFSRHVEGALWLPKRWGIIPPVPKVPKLLT